MKTDIQCYHVQQALAVPRRSVRFSAAFIKQGDITRVSVIFKMWGGIVKDRLNVVSVYLLTVFMFFTCFNSHHYASVYDCLCYVRM